MPAPMQTKSATQTGPFASVLPLVLASGSPRRREALTNLGLDFRQASSAAEPGPEPGEEPAAYAVRAALAKGADVAKAHPRAVVIAADTIVVAPDGTILGKPKDQADARATLARLAGNSITVITGCAVFAPGAEPCTLTVPAMVDMAPASARAIAAYVATGEPMDKAGSFAVQGAGAFLVAGVRGSVSSVVGLPVAEVVNLLLELEAIAPAATSAATSAAAPRGGREEGQP